MKHGMRMGKRHIRYRHAAASSLLHLHTYLPCPYQLVPYLAERVAYHMYNAKMLKKSICQVFTLPTANQAILTEQSYALLLKLLSQLQGMTRTL